MLRQPTIDGVRNGMKVILRRGVQKRVDNEINVVYKHTIAITLGKFSYSHLSILSVKYIWALWGTEQNQSKMGIKSIIE